MRRLWRRVAGGSHISDHVSTIHGHAFLEPLGVVVQVSVVVTVHALAVKFVNRQATRFAEEEFLNDAVLDRYNRCSARLQYVGGLMRFASGPSLLERVLKIAGFQARNGRGQFALRQPLIIFPWRKLRWHRQAHARRTYQPDEYSNGEEGMRTND